MTEQLTLFDHPAIEPLDPTLPCADCGASTMEINEFYMVRKQVWAVAGVGTGPGDFLCIGCLEERLGRLLGAADFTEAPINLSPLRRARELNLPPIPHSARLANRLGYVG